ncbi:MAG: single-stranded DNA-binding protein [Flavobacteriales bacterium]|nr:single-stranded DNA-binding protein [Flavobacteriales bacterium]NCA19579.1 single-stranded DNA-binding protein [Crocinitomicaceae bacterium]
MATIFETRLIGNIGKDAVVRTMERGIIAINFPVAHNKNWKDKRTGEVKTKTTWVNCTIWKREGANVRIIDFLNRGTLVEVIGSPFAKGYMQEDGSIRTEIRLNASKTNILRPVSKDDDLPYELLNDESAFESTLDDYSMDDEDYN